MRLAIGKTWKSDGALQGPAAPIRDKQICQIAGSYKDSRAGQRHAHGLTCGLQVSRKRNLTATFLSVGCSWQGSALHSGDNI